MELHTISPSVRRTTRRPIGPGWGEIPMEPDDHAEVTRIAVSIFADCVNRGMPFQDALLAVYLSGLQHGVNR